jgi:hypothetical protein
MVTTAEQDLDEEVARSFRDAARSAAIPSPAKLSKNAPGRRSRER